MVWEFSGDIWCWRGPAPYHFVSVPPAVCAELREVAAALTYGWGMIPGTLRIGGTTWTSSLWPKDGGYVVPVKDAVRRAEGVAEGDLVMVQLQLQV